MVGAILLHRPYLFINTTYQYYQYCAEDSQLVDITEPETIPAMSKTHCLKPMKVDLHCHSYYSDGKQSPEFLVQRAIENQVTHLALTDHDCIDGLLQPAVVNSGITVINGLELSCLWNNLEVHVVGLLFDIENKDIRGLLAAQQTQRELRARAIDEKLRKLSIYGLMPYLQGLPCRAYTRSHIADFLVQENICKNRQKAFKTHLGNQGKAYVAASCCSLATGIAGIRAAGGIAVLAHPGRYSLGKKKLSLLLDDFKDCGGEAMEASYSNIDASTKACLSKLAEEKSLYVSVGSDFHDAAASWTDIGKFPALDQQAKKNAIWLHPKWHCSISQTANSYTTRKRTGLSSYITTG